MTFSGSLGSYGSESEFNLNFNLYIDNNVNINISQNSPLSSTEIVSVTDLNITNNYASVSRTYDNTETLLYNPNDYLQFVSNSPLGVEFDYWLLSNGTHISSGINYFINHNTVNVTSTIIKDLPYGLTFTGIFSLINGVQFQINATSDVVSFINPFGTNFYAYGSNATFTFYSINNGFTLQSLVVNGISVSWKGNTTYGTYTIYNIQQNYTIIISALSSGLEFLSGGGGSLTWVVISNQNNNNINVGLSGNLGQFYNFVVGDVIQITANPSSGYTFSYFDLNYGALGQASTDIHSGNNPLTVIYSENGYITVNFNLINSGTSGTSGNSVNSITPILVSIFGNIKTDIVFVIFGIIVGLLTWKFAMTGLIAGIGISTFLCVMAGLLSIWAVGLCIVLDVTLIVLGSGLLNKTENKVQN